MTAIATDDHRTSLVDNRSLFKAFHSHATETDDNTGCSQIQNDRDPEVITSGNTNNKSEGSANNSQKTETQVFSYLNRVLAVILVVAVVVVVVSVTLASSSASAPPSEGSYAEEQLQLAIQSHSWHGASSVGELTATTPSTDSSGTGTVAPPLSPNEEIVYPAPTSAGAQGTLLETLKCFKSASNIVDTDDVMVAKLIDILLSDAETKSLVKKKLELEL
jgi:hypothetical protein